MPDPQMRAADTDREAVARRLGAHMAVGRLTPSEYEERVARAYSAKTYGDLAELTADLPSQPTTAGPASRPRPSSAGPCGTGRCGTGPWGGPWMGSHRWAEWGSWVTTALIVLAIWLLTSIASGGLQYFWPMWVIGPWGVMLLVRTLSGPPPRRDRRRLGV